MRTIKFKAWHKSSRTLGEVLQYYPLNGACKIEGVTEFAHTGEYELCQFTGYCDQVGNEIFEGDILAPTWVGGYVEVKWDEDEQGWLPKMSRANTQWLSAGNIYQNPELLETKGGT